MSHPHRKTQPAPLTVLLVSLTLSACAVPGPGIVQTTPAGGFVYDRTAADGVKLSIRYDGGDDMRQLYIKVKPDGTAEIGTAAASTAQGLVDMASAMRSLTDRLPPPAIAAEDYGAPIDCPCDSDPDPVRDGK